MKGDRRPARPRSNRLEDHRIGTPSPAETTETTEVRKPEAVSAGLDRRPGLDRRRFLRSGSLLLGALIAGRSTDLLAGVAPEIRPGSPEALGGAQSTAASQAATGTASQTATPVLPRSLALFQTHTLETLETVYWREGEYIPDALSRIDVLLRDHRTDDVLPIDRELLDQLVDLQGVLGTSEPFHVISGYRSPATNRWLQNRGGGGVARKSLHMVGRAIDIRIPGTDLKRLRETALSMGRGGVGYYPASRFVHLDTGRVRFW